MAKTAPGKTASEIENHLAELREKRGLSAASLAHMVGVSRQTIYAMEAGSYVPNTALALQLAHVLEVAVEQMFSLAADVPAPELRTETATLLPGSAPVQAGEPVQLCMVDKRLIASVPSPVPWYFPPSDAVLAAGYGATRDKTGSHRTKVQVFQAGQEFRNRILVAGCDPAISVLAHNVQAAGIELVLAHRNSSQALELLREGCVHVAGMHLPDSGADSSADFSVEAAVSGQARSGGGLRRAALREAATGESNLAAIGQLFPRKSVAVISFAVWEEGIVTARGNPKGIRGAEDFARADVRIVNREVGAGSRKLLDAQLKRLGIAALEVHGYEREAPGHLAAAWQVQTGSADACIATRAAARAFGLGFLPLVTERYDLAVRREHLDLPGIQTLFNTLGRTSFRREIESLGGYDTRAAGERMM
jgi:putative molybdopterin biosynthesis protein